MKLIPALSFIGGCFLGICLSMVFILPATEEYEYKPNSDVIFVLEAVHNDTSLQHMILDPAYRCRIKQAEKELK